MGICAQFMLLNFIVQEVFYCDGRERADDEDFSLDGLILSDKQRKVIDIKKPYSKRSTYNHTFEEKSSLVSFLYAS